MSYHIKIIGKEDQYLHLVATYNRLWLGNFQGRRVFSRITTTRKYYGLLKKQGYKCKIIKEK